MQTYNLLSIDVGIKNCAYCLFEIKDKQYNIISWDVVNLCDEKKYTCCGINKSGKKEEHCQKEAKYIKNDKTYCKSHAKKVDYQIPTSNDDIDKIKKMKLIDLYNYADEHMVEYKKPITKIKLIELITIYINENYFQPIKMIKTNQVDLIQIGRSLKNQFDSIFNDYFDNIKVVAIENQISPIANRMKTLQGMLTQYFIMKTDANIFYVNASNKLKINDNKEKQVTNYNERKKEGIKITTNVLLNNSHIDDKWNKVLQTSKKKDDLCDCFLQGLWVIENK
jgi:hypothetical protein